MIAVRWLRKTPASWALLIYLSVSVPFEGSSKEAPKTILDYIKPFSHVLKLLAFACQIFNEILRNDQHMRPFCI